MGILDMIKGEFIEIVEWLDETNDTLVHRFADQDHEIKMGAQLTVRENQVALFVNEGKAADLFGPGRYSLTTQNIPILTTLRGWKYGFNSPFKAEIYFFNTRLFTDLKWGTANPVMMRDTDFGMIRVRAFGTYAMRIADAKGFFAAIVGTRGVTSTEDITGQLRSTILSKLSDVIAESKVAALDISSKYEELSLLGKQKLSPEFASFGLDLSRFIIENVSLPEEVEAAIDQRTKLGVLGDKLGKYTQLQTADAIKLAAQQPGGAAGAGVGLGAGIAMGHAMGAAFQQPAAPPAYGAPPPPPTGSAPPPPPASGGARWSIAVDGKTYGPYTDDALKQMVAAGQVASSAMAWRPGAAGWAPVATFEELSGGASAMPPPPPPPAR